MSSLFSHIFIPVAILIIFSNKLKLDTKKVIVLSFFAILPDADILIDHRASFHNIFILIIPILTVIFIKDVKISGIIGFYLISHLILDTFNGGIFLLYPLYDNVFFLRADIWFYDKNIVPAISYGISSDIVSVSNIGEEPMISSENIGVVILLIILTLSSIIINRYNKYKYGK